MKRMLTVLGLFAFSCMADKPTEMFPFVISYDAQENVVNMAHLLDAPAGKHGFVRVKEGRFATDKGPIRFHATNLTGPANFPTHAEADRMADRMARFGINCVRLHYFDSTYGNFMQEQQQGILTEDFRTRRQLDPAQRDKQDYLIAAFKKRGIYVNINLHVARTLDARDGFAPGTPWANKGVDAFDPRIIELEKEYARDLLTHVNPYTGLSYTDDPCVAMVELNNEDSIFNQYFGGGLDHLGQPYATLFRNQWNEWLLAKYGTTEKMRAHWNFKTQPLGTECIQEGRFDTPVQMDGKQWILSLGGAKAQAAAKDGAMKINVTEMGGEYFPKLFRRIVVKKGEAYTVSFKVRKTKGKGTSELGFAIADSTGGWRGLGVLRRLHVGNEWKTIKTSFYATDSSDKAEIQLTRFPIGEYELDDLSFKTGGDFKNVENLSIEKGEMPIVRSVDTAPMPMQRDFYQFLVDTERKYWTGMRKYLINELKLKVPVSGTQMGYSPPHVQADLDYIDHHAYWCHPSVHKYWTIRNLAMVNTLGGCVLGLAGTRVAGKPFTVSEYNHPYPIYYGAEGQLMLRAYGALQGWDGVFEYTYNNRKEAEPDYNSYFFGIVARTDVLAHFPACAALYLRGDVRESTNPLIAPLPYDRAFDQMVGNRTVHLGLGTAGVSPVQSLVRKVAIDVTGKAPAPQAVKAIHNPAVSDTNELIWDLKAGWMVNTPNTKVYSGFPKGPIALGEVTLEIGKTRLNWATVSLMSHDATGFGEDGKAARILLAATGLSHNHGAKFTEHAGNQISCRGEDWGKGPVMNEGIPAKIILPADAAKTHCYALDPAGNRKAKVPVATANEKRAQIEIGPAYQTVWYEIVINK